MTSFMHGYGRACFITSGSGHELSFGSGDGAGWGDGSGPERLECPGDGLAAGFSDGDGYGHGYVSTDNPEGDSHEN